MSVDLNAILKLCCEEVVWFLITGVDAVEELKLMLVLGAHAAPLCLAQSPANSLKPDLFFIILKINQVWFLSAF